MPSTKQTGKIFQMKIEASSRPVIARKAERVRAGSSLRRLSRKKKAPSSERLSR